MIFQYNDGTSCSLGEVCKCQTVIFSQNQIPVCDCPPAKCGDVFVNLETGDIYGFFGYAWDIIGNIKGATGPTGLLGPTGPTGSIETYTGTGVFGPGFANDINYNQAINLLRQPGTYYPTFFGTGIATDISRTPHIEAIVIGNHSDATGPNNSANTIAIGYYSGQQNQSTGAIAIGYQAGYNSQGNDSIAIGTSAGQQNQGNNAIAIGNSAGVTNQDANSIVICADGSGSASAGINTCVVKPIRNVSNANYLLYDAVSGEITYNPSITPSSIRYKTNVTDIHSKFIDAIYNLRPVEFDFKEKNKHAIGFIAEEVVEHIPEIILYKELEPGKIESIDYEKLVVPLVKIVQDYKKQITTFELTNKLLEERLNKLEQRFENL
jgi:hypothetical protein